MSSRENTMSALNVEATPDPLEEATMNRYTTTWVTYAIVCLYISLFLTGEYINNCPNNRAKALSGNEAGGESSSESGKSSTTDDNVTCHPDAWGRFSLENSSYVYFGITRDATIKVGGYVGKYLPQQPWRLVTAFCIIEDVGTLLVVLIVTMVVGTVLEVEYGPAKVALIFLISGLGTTMFAHFLKPINTALACGAGPVFGLVATMLGESLTNWNTQTEKGFRIFLSLLLLILMGRLPVGYAVVGGPLVGFLLAFVLLAKPQRTDEGLLALSRTQYILRAIASVLLFVFFLTLSIMLIAFTFA